MIVQSSVEVVTEHHITLDEGERFVVRKQFGGLRFTVNHVRIVHTRHADGDVTCYVHASGYQVRADGKAGMRLLRDTWSMHWGDKLPPELRAIMTKAYDIKPAAS